MISSITIVLSEAKGSSAGKHPGEPTSLLTGELVFTRIGALIVTGSRIKTNIRGWLDTLIMLMSDQF